jgi:hypothetical protein
LCAQLRFNLDDADLGAVHAGRKLVSVDHTLCQTIDQPFHTVPQFLELQF